jgi:thiol-disulfide isomerase/thioredoxin
MAKQVIKFFADWCGPCKVYAPAFEQVKQELQSEEIIFKEVNIENDPENISGEYGIKQIPFTLVLEEGADTRALSGRLAVEELRSLILN